MNVQQNEENDLKQCLNSIISVSEFIKSSLGPKSGDKLIVDENGDIQVSNDGYTILKYLSRSDSSTSSKIDLNYDLQEHKKDIEEKDSNSSTVSEKDRNNIIYQSMIKLLMDSCKTQERSFGDGTTSLIVLVGSLCSQVYQLFFEKGIKNPYQIIRVYQDALDDSLNLLNNLKFNVNLDYNKMIGSEQEQQKDKEESVSIQSVAENSLESKSVSFYRKELSRMAIDAISNLRRSSTTKDGHFELKRIGLHYLEGSSIENSKLIRGVLLMNKFFSHENMKKSCVGDKEGGDIKVLLLSSTLELPKPKTKFEILITSQEDWQQLYNYRKEYYEKVIKKLKDLKVDCVFCQWGVDQELNQLMFTEGIHCVGWVSGDDLDRLSLASASRVHSDLFQLTSTLELGRVGIINELVNGSTSERYILIDECPLTSIFTILVRGGSKEMCQEIIQSLRDCLHVAHGCFTNPTIIPGGGVPELYLYSNHQYKSESTSFSNSKISIIKDSFYNALLSLPISIFENSGIDWNDEFSTLLQIHKQCIESQSHSSMSMNLNYDYELNPQANTNKLIDMKFRVWELLDLKKSILKLSVETISMIIKIDKSIII
ncbi:hypothetical protein DLAC_10550 [Tieghemostelium lacteum]|uniref:Uncharacterized protein n=1 Tax=Tieghemostelium lacteum TaxID=361077 RepID=A0A151Z4R6_TIELA|nr:hypothetical protein DLAC_10550 [Tieghemostelium lacteum]|eukprot:KYQ88962.1 hypothetical protein DLAC_10550 [Tieghemostelium lacteum]